MKEIFDLRIKDNRCQTLMRIEHTEDSIKYYWEDTIRVYLDTHFAKINGDYRKLLDLIDEEFPEVEIEEYVKIKEG